MSLAKFLKQKNVRMKGEPRRGRALPSINQNNSYKRKKRTFGTTTSAVLEYITGAVTKTMQI